MDREETKIITKFDLMMFIGYCVLLGTNIAIWLDKGDDISWLTKFAVVALVLSIVLTVIRWIGDWCVLRRSRRVGKGSAVDEKIAAKKDDVGGEKI